jgi:flagellar biosynthesis protein
VQKAVALKYDAAERDAPEVVASGRGRIAEKIIELAKARGIYIKQDPDLVEVLSKLDIGDAIPPELYAVIAEILAFVYRLNARRDPRNSQLPSSR